MIQEINNYKLISNYNFSSGIALSKKEIEGMIDRVVKALTEEKLHFCTSATGNCAVIGLYGKSEDGTQEIEIYVTEQYKHFVFNK